MRKLTAIDSMQPKHLANASAYRFLAVCVSFPILLSGLGCANARSEVRFIEGPEMRAWEVSWAALALRAIDRLGEAGINRVLLLPPTGSVHVSFPDASPGAIVWSHGTADATRNAITSIFNEQDIPTVERTFSQIFARAHVPLVDRSPEAMDAIMAESDFQGVFASTAAAARLGRLVAAEGICLIQYDLSYNVSIDVLHGSRKVINHPRYVLRIKCVDVRDGSLLCSGHVDTEEIRRATAKRYGAGDPYYIVCLAAVEPDLALHLETLPYTFRECLLARAFVHTHPIYASKLRRPKAAAELIRRARDLPGERRDLWLVQAEMAYAMCIRDEKAHSKYYSEAEELLSKGAAWWRDLSLKSYQYPSNP